MLRDRGKTNNRSPKELKIATLVFPQIDNTSRTKQNSNQQVPLSGTIDEIGNDLRKIKEMGVEHVIFGFMGMDSKQLIDTVKQFSRFAI